MPGKFVQFSSGTAAKCLCSVKFIHFILRTLSALTRIDLAGSFGLRLDLVNQVSNCLGGTEEQILALSSGNPSQSARGLSPGWRDGAIRWLCFLACPGCGVLSERRNFISKPFKRVRSVQFACLIGSTASSVQFGALGSSASVQFVQFSSVHELFRPCREQNAPK